VSFESIRFICVLLNFNEFSNVNCSRVFVIILTEWIASFSTTANNWSASMRVSLICIFIILISIWLMTMMYNRQRSYVNWIMSNLSVEWSWYVLNQWLSVLDTLYSDLITFNTQSFEIFINLINSRSNWT
jgi:hypothetical protein